MEQKRVNFLVAKAIRNAGYPQGGSSNCYNADTGEFHCTSCTDTWLETGDYIDAPSYIDTWLWLWREKKINIDISKAWDTEVRSWVGEGRDAKMFMRHDPEEVIIAAIDYLVENNLIK